MTRRDLVLFSIAAFAVLAGVEGLFYLLKLGATAIPLKVGLETIAIMVALALWGRRLVPQMEESQRLIQQVAQQMEGLRQAEHQVLQAAKDQALAEVAGGIARGFNKSLSAIIGFVEVAIDEATEARVRQRLELIREAAFDAAITVRRLQLFSKKSEERDVSVPVNINEAVSDAVAITRPKWQTEAQRRGASIRVKLNLGWVPTVIGNPSELKEMLVNLIFNAADAMPEGGDLVIGTGRENGWAYVEVQDSGIGMAPEVQQQAFEPFFTTKGEPGLGLGLPVCRAIALRHGGDISIKTQKGKGTTFIVRLPAAKVAEDAPARALPTTRSLHILLIEDEDIVREALANTLHRLDHEVESISHGAAAIERFKRRHFDVVITDWVMPQVSGLDVARQVKRLSPQTPVILITGFGQAVPDPTPNVDLVLSKPVTRESLSEALAKVMVRR